MIKVGLVIPILNNFDQAIDLIYSAKTKENEFKPVKDIHKNGKRHVYKITTEQYNNIVDKSYAPDCYFNPILDANNNCIITIEELNGIVFPEFLYLNEQECNDIDGQLICHYINVEPIEYVPVPTPPFPPK